MSHSLGECRPRRRQRRLLLLLHAFSWGFFFFPLETRFWCVDSSVKSRARLQKTSRVRACWEAKTLTHTNPHARSLARNVEAAWGDVFPVLWMVWADESAKVQSRSSRIYWKDFFFLLLTSCLKGLHIKRVGLSPVLLLSLLPASRLYRPHSRVCSRLSQVNEACCKITRKEKVHVKYVNVHCVGRNWRMGLGPGAVTDPSHCLRSRAKYSNRKYGTVWGQWLQYQWSYSPRLTQRGSCEIYLNFAFVVCI